MLRFANKFPHRKFYSPVIIQHSPVQALGSSQQNSNVSNKQKNEKNENTSKNDKFNYTNKETRQATKVDKNNKKMDPDEKFYNYYEDPRIGKILPPKPKNEEIAKEALEENKREIEKKWLKWNILGSFSVIFILSIFVFGGKQEVRKDTTNPNKTYTSFLGLDIEVERGVGSRRFFQKSSTQDPLPPIPPNSVA